MKKSTSALAIALVAVFALLGADNSEAVTLERKMQSPSRMMPQKQWKHSTRPVMKQRHAVQPHHRQNCGFNNAFSAQNGALNGVQVQMKGCNNNADVRQNGLLNSGTVVQDGYRNNTRLQQNGIANDAAVIQHGHTNGATVNQNGHINNATIIQD